MMIVLFIVFSIVYIVIGAMRGSYLYQEENYTVEAAIVSAVFWPIKFPIWIIKSLFEGHKQLKNGTQKRGRGR